MTSPATTTSHLPPWSSHGRHTLFHLASTWIRSTSPTRLLHQQPATSEGSRAPPSPWCCDPISCARSASPQFCSMRPSLLHRRGPVRVKPRPPVPVLHFDARYHHAPSLAVAVGVKTVGAKFVFRHLWDSPSTMTPPPPKCSGSTSPMSCLYNYAAKYLYR